MNTRQHVLLTINRIAAIVEHANLSDSELRTIDAEVNELYERHLKVDEQGRRASRAVAS